jgi:hypothetical protein
MKVKQTHPNDPSPEATLAALKRAARNAVELARQTGTHAWVLEGNKIVDAARQPRGKSKKKTAPRKRTPRS